MRQDKGKHTPWRRCAPAAASAKKGVSTSALHKQIGARHCACRHALSILRRRSAPLPVTAEAGASTPAQAPCRSQPALDAPERSSTPQGRPAVQPASAGSWTSQTAPERTTKSRLPPAERQTRGARPAEIIRAERWPIPVWPLSITLVRPDVRACRSACSAHTTLLQLYAQLTAAVRTVCGMHVSRGPASAAD